jgi:hypothetical protein
MAAGNPFVYGEVATARAFADRERERDRLARDLAEGQKVFLISPRRYGKSSLVRDVMTTLASRRILTVEVTVAASSSYVAFLEAYARALLAAHTPPTGLRKWAGELLKTVRHPRSRIAGLGRFRTQDPGSGILDQGWGSRIRGSAAARRRRLTREARITNSCVKVPGYFCS